ncbi:helix-turn-helix transcriptional regulator, partial [Klebsiella pneumoniae]
MNEINEIADRLKEVRKKSGKRQQPFADSILVSQSAYSAYEHAKREIPMEGANKQVISSQADSLIKISR